MPWRSAKVSVVFILIGIKASEPDARADDDDAMSSPA